MVFVASVFRGTNEIVVFAMSIPECRYYCWDYAVSRISRLPHRPELPSLLLVAEVMLLLLPLLR